MSLFKIHISHHTPQTTACNDDADADAAEARRRKRLMSEAI